MGSKTPGKMSSLYKESSLFYNEEGSLISVSPELSLVIWLFSHSTQFSPPAPPATFNSGACIHLIIKYVPQGATKVITLITSSLGSGS